MKQLIDGGTMGDDVTLQEISSRKCLIHIQWERVGTDIRGGGANLELRFYSSTQPFVPWIFAASLLLTSTWGHHLFANSDANTVPHREFF